MKMNLNIDLAQELKEPLPKGTYVLEYTRDGFSNSDTIIDIFCTVVKADDPKFIGETCKIQTCFSNSNKQIVAIGNSIRNQIFKACIGKEVFELEQKQGGINTSKLYGCRFQCDIDLKETEYGLNPYKNVFKGFKCILTPEEQRDLALTKFGYSIGESTATQS